MVSQVYKTSGTGTQQGVVPIIFANRNPATTDLTSPDGGSYQLFQAWKNTINGSVFQYGGAGLWVEFVNDGNAVYPITRYVVGPSGEAGYQTIQSAINAAHAASGGTVYIQPGSYTENLTLYDNVDIQGANNGAVVITGLHTPPTTGSVYIAGVNLVSATHIISSTAAGSAGITFDECTFTVTNGYTLNLPNWTGFLQAYDSGDVGSTNNGIVNNTGGSGVQFQSTTMGAGTANPMIVSGFHNCDNSYFNCPWSPTTGCTFTISSSGFSKTLTLGGSCTGDIRNAYIFTASAIAVTMSSSAAISLSNVSIKSTNNPAIGGAGAGVLTLGGVTFLSNSTIASTVTKVIVGSAYGSFTPYTVGTAGNAAYQTIQSAITAATATGGVVYIQPGTYTENLTLVSNVTLLGASNNTTIITGVHTPPASGLLYFNNIKFISTTDVLNSSAAGSTTITFDDCLFTITTGYIMNLLNWTGSLSMFICGDLSSTTNGVISNTGGSSATLQSVTLGAGTANAMVTSGTVTLGNAYFNCPWSPTTGTIIDAANVGFSKVTTLGGNTTGSFRGSFWEAGTATAITMSSSAAVNILGGYINTSNATAIGGSGAGALSLDTTFKQSAVVAGTLTLTPIGIYQPLTVVAAGASPRTCNSRAGTVTFSSVSIAAGATQSLVISNTSVPSNTTRVLYSLSGATTGAALTVQSVTASAATSLTFVVLNGTGATTTTANITIDFLLLN